jgi:Glyoxalase-like domain
MAIRWLTIFLDFPAQDFGTGVAFWREITGSGLSPYRGTDGEFATLLPSAGDPWLRVQRVRDGTGGCHLDLHLDGGDAALTDTAGRAVSLGARVEHRDNGLVILDSPGRFRFCLVRWEQERTVPGPVVLGDEGASRADQLCLDIGPGAFDRECSFWAELTGWDLRAGVRPEFAYLERPGGMPARLLLQRRTAAGEGDGVTGHVDFACAEPARLAPRHVGSGARIVAPLSHWVTMADPTGRPYCLTMRDPLTGKLR